jgi:hypothetical protein
MTAPRRLRAACKAEILWTVAAFLAGHLTFLLYAECRWPGLYDREFGTRLDLLRARHAAAPAAPLLAVVGSSRVGMAFLPERLPALRTPEGVTAVPFNFSHQEAGPLYNLLQTHRLVRQGLRPRWLVVELCPLFWWEEHSGVCTRGATLADLPVLLAHTSAGTVLQPYLRARLLPAYQHRQGALQQLAPPLATEVSRGDRIRLSPLGGDEEWCALTTVTPAQRDRARRPLLAGVAAWRPLEVERYDRATRALLALCRRERIEVALLLTPEDSLVRAHYPPALRQFEAYVAGLAAENGVAVCDARAWLGEDDFSDGHHALLGGAARFTQRLHAEVLEPLVAGRLRPASPASGPTARR